MPERPRSSNSSLGLCCKRGRPRITLPFPLRGGGRGHKLGNNTTYYAKSPFIVILKSALVIFLYFFWLIFRITSADKNNFLPGYLGIMATRHVLFCCIFAVAKDKFDHF